MAKGVSNSMDSSLADQIRRAQKAKQKAAVRKGKKDTQPSFTFADVKKDKREAVQNQRIKLAAIKFGQQVDQQLHAWLDAADAADNRGIQLVATSEELLSQARWELQAWISRSFGYALNGNTLVCVKKAKAA